MEQMTLEQILEKEKQHRSEEGMFGIKACKDSILFQENFFHNSLDEQLKGYVKRANEDVFFNRAMILACYELMQEREKEQKAQANNIEKYKSDENNVKEPIKAEERLFEDDSEITIEDEVIFRIKQEDTAYRNKILNGTTFDAFTSSEETFIRALIVEAIRDGFVNTEDYKLLNQIEGSITDRIFEEYCNDADATISEPVNCSVFIDNFCKEYIDEKDKEIIYQVCEEGYERHDGEFFKCFVTTKDFNYAKEIYERELNDIKTNNDFFLQDNLDDMEEGEHIPSCIEKPLPYISIENEMDNERYELYISATEIEEKKNEDNSLKNFRKASEPIENRCNENIDESCEE